MQQNEETAIGVIGNADSVLSQQKVTVLRPRVVPRATRIVRIGQNEMSDAVSTVFSLIDLDHLTEVRWSPCPPFLVGRIEPMH
jgi:hypothetical protein